MANQLKFNYHLCDDGGVSTIWDLPILLTKGTIFTHEYGTYEVTQYLTKDGVTQIACERISNNKL